MLKLQENKINNSSFFRQSPIRDRTLAISELKLAAGISFAFLAIIESFLILSGVLQQTTEVVEVWDYGLELSNATIIFLSGTFILFLTLTRIGVDKN